MWLMTKHGFFSIVCAHDDKGRPHKDLMMVRARKKEHLERLEVFGSIYHDIRETEHTDYPYRVIIDRDAAVLLVARLMEEVNYSNFKNAAKAGTHEAEYNTFLHTVWAAGLRLTARCADAMNNFWQRYEAEPETWAPDNAPPAKRSLGVWDTLERRLR